MTAKKLYKLEDIVKPILEESEDSRNDDYYLYCKVLESTNPEAMKHSLFSCLMRHKELGLPSYESVSRVRRRLQAKYPHLESERTRKRRMKETEAYIEYARTV